MAPPRRAERSRADRAMPKARGPDGRARERCLPGRPPVPTPARAIGSPPRRPRHAAARESAPRYAAARSADTGSLLLLYYGANAESASERALVLRVRNVSRAGALRTVCGRCGMPLRVDYALQRFEPAGPPTLWRYGPVLPLDPAAAVTLGEGFTPLLRVDDQLW